MTLLKSSWLVLLRIGDIPHSLAIIPLGLSVSVGEVASHGGRGGNVLVGERPWEVVRSTEEEVWAKGARCRESGDKARGNGGRGRAMEGDGIADVAYRDESIQKVGGKDEGL